jgi:hypothetical protein
MNIEGPVVYIIAGGIAIIALVAIVYCLYNLIIKIGEKMGIDPYDSEINVRYSTKHQDDKYLK